MNKNLLNIIIGIVAVYLVIRASLLMFPGHYTKIEGFTQGTSYHITYKDQHNINLTKEVDSILADFDHSLSTYLPGSIISEINQNDSNVITDKHFRVVFKKAQEVYKATNGAFDITVAPVVNAWGFGFTAGEKVDSNLIDSLLQYVGMNKVNLKNDKVIKKYPQTMLDVNAIAQGYSVDVVAEYLERKGIGSYLVEIGGEVRTKGRNPKNKRWVIGIDKPVEYNFSPGKMLQTKIRISNGSIATSGNYRSFYEKNGVKYTHSINPKTGYPVLSNLLSTTVEAPDCITADAYATAFMVMGLDKTIAFLKLHHELQAYLVYSDKHGQFRSYVTGKLKRKLRR